MVSCLLALAPIPHGVCDSTLYPVTVFSLTESLIMHSCWILTVGLATWFVLAYASSQPRPQVFPSVLLYSCHDQMKTGSNWSAILGESDMSRTELATQAQLQGTHMHES